MNSQISGDLFSNMSSNLDVLKKYQNLFMSIINIFI